MDIEYVGKVNVRLVTDTTQAVPTYEVFLGAGTIAHGRTTDRHQALCWFAQDVAWVEGIDFSSDPSSPTK